MAEHPWSDAEPNRGRGKTFPKGRRMCDTVVHVSQVAVAKREPRDNFFNTIAASHG
jgi:hypothetical protein